MANIDEYLRIISNGVYGKDVRKAIHDGIRKCYDDNSATPERVEAIVTQWLEDHPEATTTVQDGSLTLAKMNQEVTEHIKSDGLKKMWSIQTNANGDSTFYGLACSVDGLGHTLVEDYYNFLDVDNRNLGTDWIHFQHDDYHVFTITHKTNTVDFYIAITKDFENWTHGTVNIGLSTASGYNDPYVWTPQIFEFGNKLYIGATVQEDAPVDNGDIYGITLLRKSGIYIAEITLDYETALVNRVSTFTRVSFGEIHDKSGNSYDVSGNVMDAFFVPNGDNLCCVFNERYMQEIHTAVANNISDTFTILAENIFDMPYTEAPTVLQINNNLWRISACLWNTAFSAEEENLCCYTSDFETFFDRGVMERIDVVQANRSYTGRMRNPSFFYMTYEQEHDFCKNHDVHTNGYIHEFKPVKKTFSEGYKSVLNHTNVTIQPNVAFKSLSGSAITLSDDFSDVTLTDLVFLKSGDVVTLICQLGNVKLVSGQNIIGEIHEMFRPSFTIPFVAYAGIGTTLGTAIRGDITPTGSLRLYSGTNWSGYNSIRGECCYLTV